MRSVEHLSCAAMKNIIIGVDHSPPALRVGDIQEGDRLQGPARSLRAGGLARCPRSGWIFRRVMPGKPLRKFSFRGWRRGRRPAVPRPHFLLRPLNFYRVYIGFCFGPGDDGQRTAAKRRAQRKKSAPEDVIQQLVEGEVLLLALALELGARRLGQGVHARVAFLGHGARLVLGGHDAAGHGRVEVVERVRQALATGSSIHMRRGG